MNREYGVLVARIAGVCFAGVKAAGRGRRGSSGNGYNRNLINDLGNKVAGAKKSKYLHRDQQGEKVKRVAPAALRFPYGTVGRERKVEKWHLNLYKVPGS